MSPELAEVTACHMGACLAISIQVMDIVFETDCITMIQKLNSQEKDLTTMGLLVSDINSLCSSFNFCSFKYQPRTCNKVAHVLVQLSFSCNSITTWFEEFPMEVLDVAFADISLA